MYFKKETRYELRYIAADGKEKKCFPRSEEKKNENLAICKERGYRVVSCKKLYPFSMEKNQHNFELIRNICFNTMSDMDSGEIPYDAAEYARLSDLKDKAERCFGLPLPIAWLPWETYKEAKELAFMAILHRQEACIANGRPDLVTYC
jgi:hypothetical protein